MMSGNKTIVLSATAFGWLVVVAAMSWGESRYHDGYRAAEAKAEKQRNEAAEQMRPCKLIVWPSLTPSPYKQSP